MKAINKDDLIIVLNAVKDRSTLDLDDLKTLLDEFGDEYFIEDGAFVKTTENQEMAAVRNVEELRPASKIIEEQEESIKILHKDVENLMYQLVQANVKINELQRKIEGRDIRIGNLLESNDALRDRLEEGDKI